MATEAGFFKKVGAAIKKGAENRKKNIESGKSKESVADEPKESKAGASTAAMAQDVYQSGSRYISDLEL